MTKKIILSDELPMIAFTTSDKLDQWLNKNHDIEAGLWLHFFKKDSGVPSISYVEAVLVALCYGWIDSIAEKYDDKSYIQKFTPRRSKSIWSKINTERVERLTKEGKMKPSGIAQVEVAKNDGRWDQAYNPPSRTELPKEFLIELSKNKKAYEFFKTLNKTNTFAIAWRIETAKKPETKQKRMVALIKMLSEGKKIH